MMEPTLQVPLIGGLVILLVLLLVVRSGSRRRAARTAEVAEPAVTLFEAGDDAPVLEDGQLDRPMSGPDETEAQDLSDDLHAALSDPVSPAGPARRGILGRRARRSDTVPVLPVVPEAETLDGIHSLGAPDDAVDVEPAVHEVASAADQPAPVDVETTVLDEEMREVHEEAAPGNGAVPDVDMATVVAGDSESLDVPAEPVAKRRRLFGRRPKTAATPVAEPTPELAGEPVGELAPELAEELAAALADGLAVETDAVLEPTQGAGDATITSAIPVDAGGAEPEASDTSAQSEIKALREQLRALELVVQQQAADHPTTALAKVEEAAAEQSAAYLRQVSLVVSGLAAHTDEEENPRRTLARVAAAVERLGVPNSMERPILPVSHELPSRSHGEGEHHPSHLLEPRELGVGTADEQVGAADVFAGLDTVTAPRPPLAPQPPPQPQPAMQAPVPAPVHAPAPAPAPEPEVREPLFPPPSQSYAGPTTSVHDLGALAAFDGPGEPYDGVLGGIADGADAGIPAYEEPAAVLPVPPPAAPEPTGRRRGRRSR